MVRGGPSRHTRVEAYEGYAKRTMERALAATRKRHAHRIAGLSNAQEQNFGMKRGMNFGMTEVDRAVRPNNAFRIQ